MAGREGLLRGSSCRLAAKAAGPLKKAVCGCVIRLNAALRPSGPFWMNEGGGAATRLHGSGSGATQMKIGQTRSASQAGSARSAQARSSGGGFALSGASEARGTAGLSGPASLGAVDALLALQETPQSDDALHSPRRKAIRRGEEMLDILDEIKLALLTGQLPKAKLSRLLSVVERQSGSFNDPRLGQVLAEIELRARVELAKFGTYTNG